MVQEKFYKSIKIKNIIYKCDKNALKSPEIFKGSLNQSNIES